MLLRLVPPLPALATAARGTDQAAARIFARQMYTLLIHLCEGRALGIVRGAPDHDGLEAWRLLHEWYQPKTRSSGFGVAE